MSLCFGGKLGAVTMVAASREVGKIERNDCSVFDDAQYNTSTAYHCCWIFLHVNPVMVFVAVFSMCVHKTKITRRCKRLETPT